MTQMKQFEVIFWTAILLAGSAAWWWGLTAR